MKSLTTYADSKTYQGATSIKTELLKRFRNVNEYDRDKLFGFKKENDLFSAVKNGKMDEEYINHVLTWYEEEYVSPFWVGDILRGIESGKEWIVTCIYTDGSIDIISREGTIIRKNIGTIGTSYIKVGTIEVIVEPDVTLASLLN